MAGGTYIEPFSKSRVKRCVHFVHAPNTSLNMTEQNIAAATIAWSLFSQTTESEEFCSFYTGVAMVAVKTFWWSNNRPLGTKGLISELYRRLSFDPTDADDVL